MKRLTVDQSKIDLVAKLLKDGNINFSDALKLLEVEVEKEYITVPFYDWKIWPTVPYWPTITPTYTTSELITNPNDFN